MDPHSNQHQLIHRCYRRTNCIRLPFALFVKRKLGDPYRIRTDVNGVRGRCLNHLTNGPCRRKKLRSIPFGFRQSSQRSVLPPLSSANASLVCLGCLLFPHPRCTRFEYTSNRLGAPSRTRTGDPLIKSQLLYQLS